MFGNRNPQRKLEKLHNQFQVVKQRYHSILIRQSLKGCCREPDIPSNNRTVPAKVQITYHVLLKKNLEILCIKHLKTCYGIRTKTLHSICNYIQGVPRNMTIG